MTRFLVRLVAVLLVASTPVVGRAEFPVASASSAGATASCPAPGPAFRPTAARSSALGARSYRVAAVRRTPNGALGTLPVNTAAKTMFGWDPETRPGAHGTVLLNAHTWPDGSALGNKMLRRLKVGSRLRLVGAGHVICYRITSRRQYPRNRVPMGSIYRPGGRPRVAIIVCSGRRLGPGDWLKRTVWIGTAIGSAS